jgi:DNA-directed RNA polymerase specialized sigma24 family protein
MARDRTHSLARGSDSATHAEMVEIAVGLRPKLLLRALELCGGRRADAEDDVAEVYLALVRKPPAPRTPAQLHHWLRTVLQRQRDTRLRKDYKLEEAGVVFVSLDVLQGWTG